MDNNLAYRIAQAAAEEGGRAYYVGGYVRDRLLGIDNKDIDIEIHGLTAEKLVTVLGSFGEVTDRGAQYGVYGLADEEIDIALPRTERATGTGHRDFEVTVDPFMGPEAAMRRRDFTINALMMDVLTEEILDFCGGREDLQQHVIRHVNTEAYAEDPLRILRAAQFAARFDFTVADETVELSKKADLKALHGERVMDETKKALLKADKVSVYFRELDRMEQLDVWFHELKQLQETPQEPAYHPEGSVFNHIMMVLDEAAKLREQAHYPLGLMMTAMCHDFGKAVATFERNGHLHAYEHEIKGLPLVEALLKRLNVESKLKDYVMNMVRLHMRPNGLAYQKAGKSATNRMFDEAADPEDLMLMARADHFGRINPRDYAPTETYLAERYAYFKEVMAQPFVQGRDLAASGIKPGPEYRKALSYAHRLRLAGVRKDEALRRTLWYLQYGN